MDGVSQFTIKNVICSTHIDGFFRSACWYIRNGSKPVRRRWMMKITNAMSIKNETPNKTPNTMVTVLLLDVLKLGPTHQHYGIIIGIFILYKHKYKYKYRYINKCDPKGKCHRKWVDGAASMLFHSSCPQLLYSCVGKLMNSTLEYQWDKKACTGL